MLWGPWADKYHGQVSLDVQNVIISEYCNSAYVLVWNCELVLLHLVLTKTYDN